MDSFLFWGLIGYGIAYLVDRYKRKKVDEMLRESDNALQYLADSTHIIWCRIVKNVLESPLSLEQKMEILSELTKGTMYEDIVTNEWMDIQIKDALGESL